MAIDLQSAPPTLGIFQYSIFMRIFPSFHIHPSFEIRSERRIPDAYISGDNMAILMIGHWAKY